MSRSAYISFLFIGLSSLRAEGEVRTLRFDVAVKDLTPLLEKERKEQGLPAVAAVVIEKDRIVARGFAGFRKLGDRTKVGPNDRWHLGSCTKAMTATMIASLVERGMMRWDTTIEQALPDFAQEIRPEYRGVTVEQLLANRGGVVHEGEVPGLWDVLWKREGTPTEQRRRMAKSMLAQDLKVPVGQYSYSNCGFGIAGLMAETVAGKPWETLMQELLFEPLSMKSAGFGVTWDAEPPTDPWPHSKDGAPLRPGLFADNPPSIGPGGTVHAALDDWARFAFDHLKGDRKESGTLLKSESYGRLHKGISTGNGEAYALGWIVAERPWAKGADRDAKGRCLHHAGTNNSWYALIWIAPERDMAFLCATNIGGEGIFPKIDKVIGAVIHETTTRKRP